MVWATVTYIAMLPSSRVMKDAPGPRIASLRSTPTGGPAVLVAPAPLDVGEPDSSLIVVVLRSDEARDEVVVVLLDI